MEEKNKIARFELRTSLNDRSNIKRLAHRWRVSESDAVRLAVLQSLQSAEVPHIPFNRRRPIELRRKVTG